jgi:hypothetical protein
LHNELYNSYSSSEHTVVIKSRMKGWVGHVAHVGYMRLHAEFYSEDLDIDWNIKPTLDLKKVWTILVYLRMGGSGWALGVHKVWRIF